MLDGTAACGARNPVGGSREAIRPNNVSPCYGVDMAFEVPVSPSNECGQVLPFAMAV
jgi:hypothetical protein